MDRSETVGSFSQAFGLLGYVQCDTGDLESGFEKIALFTKDGIPTHAARQLETGEWTSKLGKGQDIRHESLLSLEGDACGQVTVFLRREWR